MKVRKATTARDPASARPSTVQPSTSNQQPATSKRPTTDYNKQPTSNQPAKTIMNTKRESTGEQPLLPFSQQGDVVANRGGSLCGCFSDITTCLWGYCCPCYLFGRTLQRSGATSRTWTGCVLYLLMALAGSAFALVVVLGFFGRLDKYNDCVSDQRVVPEDGSASELEDSNDAALLWTSDSPGWDARPTTLTTPVPGSLTEGAGFAPICTENGYCATGECRPAHGCCFGECQGEHIACPFCHAYVSTPAAEADDACNSLLVAAMRWYWERIMLLSMGQLVLAGILCGYYREQIKVALGGAAGSSSKLGSFLLHCLPCTHFCALCQEARAVEESQIAYGGGASVTGGGLSI